MRTTKRSKSDSVYAHLHEIKVRTGQVVRRREIIGTVGQDPDKLFAPHLHLELRWDQTLDPTYWPSSNGKDVAWVKGALHRAVSIHQKSPLSAGART
jgi:murein DD-endopeptidase MepM/ murein hydrolase activator NlpD